MPKNSKNNGEADFKNASCAVNEIQTAKNNYSARANDLMTFYQVG
jgi:hypothetical protein